MRKSAAAKPVGTLFVVATPIGNYDDITIRALNALKECDIVVCEELKEASKLLKHYDLDKEIMELNEHNDTESSVECIKLLTAGKKLALISDAGTPLLADPGDILVKAAVKYNMDVRVLPGASSVLTALVRSTHSSKQFVYAGFLSRKNEERDAEIIQLSREPRTVVLMDTPYRLKTILNALSAVMPDRQAYIGCNLTMANEAHHYGTLSELDALFESTKFRGEYVIVIEGTGEPITQALTSHDAATVQLETPKTNGRARAKSPVAELNDPLHDEVTEIPLPESDEALAPAANLEDYEPVTGEMAEQHYQQNQNNPRYQREGFDNQRRGGRDRDGRDRNWNNGGQGNRRWNNNRGRRWDNNRRPPQQDFREPNVGRPDGDAPAYQNQRGNYDNGGGRRYQQQGQGQGHRQQGRQDNRYRNNFRDHRDSRDMRDNRDVRDNRFDEQPLANPVNRENVQQPPIANDNFNNANTQPTQNNTFYDESYDYRENFGNREGANYSRFDQQNSRERNGNRSFNRGPRHSNRGNFNRGNRQNDGNHNSDNPVYGHLNDFPQKRRKW